MNMRHMLFICGIVLVLLALVLTAKAPKPGRNEDPSAGLAGDIITEHTSGVPPVVVGGTAWSQFRVTVGKQAFDVCVREYDEPVCLSEAMRHFSGSVENTTSAFAVYACSYAVAQHATDIEELAELYDDPEEYIEWWEWFGEQHGDTDKDAVLKRIKEQYSKAECSMELLGDAIIDQYYVFLVRPQGWPPMYNVLQRMPDSTYRRMRKFPDNMPVLDDMRLVELFPKYEGVWTQDVGARAEGPTDDK